MAEQTQAHGGAHPEMASEQAHIDAAYARLDQMRSNAAARAAALFDQREGTLQHLYERDVIVRTALARAEDLDIGDLSLVFGRIDRTDAERYYIGRRGVFDEARHPMVVDWRVPAAEPFYRATGRHPLGLAMRRHLMCDGRRLLGIEDERFSDDPEHAELGLAGTGALISALERARTGRMSDIVATVQREQDEIIRADLDGVLAVQGGPGTGKTAVALHRAAYLMFTHRRKLARQGILIVGPNHLFLRYIEQVLPALGESGATLVTLDDLVPDVAVSAVESPEAARVKGKPNMRRVIQRAIINRQRPLRHDVIIEIEPHDVMLRARETASLVARAKRNRKSHNLRRVMLRNILISQLAKRYADVAARANDPMPLTRKEVKRVLRTHHALRAALDEMWPELTPAKLLSDLYASPKSLAAAARGTLRESDQRVLARSKHSGWTTDDVPLLDDARWRLGIVRQSARVSDGDDADEPETFGHVVVDEVQDLSPMALRMVARRSRTGSMTVVGDLAQAVGSRQPHEWNEILRSLPTKMGSRVEQLSINYRTPAEIMRIAERVLAAATPDLQAPSSVRESGDEPVFVRADALEAGAAERARAESANVAPGTVAVLCPAALVESVHRALPEGVIDGLESPIAILSVADAKGLEFDSVVVVEPAAIVAEHVQGMHALYVALTRATKRLTIVHREELPEPLRLRVAEPAGLSS
jgi:DNA helicase IV